jgi:Ran-binding protein 3
MILSHTDIKEKDSRDTSSVSDDNDASEQPVRRKLRDTTLTSSIPNEDSTDTNGRGRLNKKRSYDDLQNEDQEAAVEGDDGQHRRKRSRDSKTDGLEASRSTRDITPETSSIVVANPGKLLSPEKKRSIDQFQNDEQKTDQPGHGSETGETQTKDSPKSKNRTEGEPEKKRHRDSSQEKEAQSETESKVSSCPFSP